MRHVIVSNVFTSKLGSILPMELWRSLGAVRRVLYEYSF